jgi:hypothetical protein
VATTVAPPPRAIPRVLDVRQPRWIERYPTWLTMGALLVALLAVSALIRTRYISGQFWMDEAITTGIASHSLSAIPGVLRHDGSPPLFYLLLHFWMAIFGGSESATHALSLLFGLLTIPVGLWAGWSLFGRRAGVYTAVLFAFSTFLTEYAQESRMYELMGLLGLIATAAFIHGFILRRRRYVILFSVSVALMLYTHAWGLFFAAGALVALIPVLRTSDDRRGIGRDAVLAYVGAGVLFIPWLPNFVYQATHTGAPWAPRIAFGVPVLLSRDLLGGDRITIGLLLALLIGLGPFFLPRFRRTREQTLLWTLITLPLATLIIAWLASQITPAFVARYMAPVLASVFLLAAWGAARSGVVGLAAIVLSVVFVAHVSSYTPTHKSDMQDVGGEVAPLLHPGDLVISGQPEQLPLAWYYLPNDLRWGTVLGPVKDPRYMDWVYALKRLRAADPFTIAPRMLASLRPGQQVLFVRPLTEGAQNWKASWTQLVRRRSAQWGEILSSDPHLVPIAWAPHNYRSACCVADSAVLYRVT